MMFKGISGAVALLLLAPASAFAPGSFSGQKKVSICADSVPPITNDSADESLWTCYY